MNAREVLDDKVRNAGAVIGFTPLQSEPPLDEYLSIIGVIPADRVPQKHDTDPVAVATSFANRFGEQALVFVPGSAFDQFGTRHGRGGGWYDRFLHSVPAWYRIGVARSQDISNTALVRESWDEPIDAILVWKDGVWDIIICPVRQR